MLNEKTEVARNTPGIPGIFKFDRADLANIEPIP